MENAWISASHGGMAKLCEEYYTKTTGSKGVTGSSQESWARENMEGLKTAWEESEDKSLETLTTLLREHKYGCGKWMIFLTAADVDAVWRKVVTALWDGKLGHSAKVSGNTPGCNGSHVINVYVDPFWETSEVTRVLSALRELCDIKDSIKFKAKSWIDVFGGRASKALGSVITNLFKKPISALMFYGSLVSLGIALLLIAVSSALGHAFERYSASGELVGSDSHALVGVAEEKDSLTAAEAPAPAPPKDEEAGTAAAATTAAAPPRKN